MATVNYLYRSSRNESFLTLRLLFRHDGKDFTPSVKTKISTDKEYWNKKHFSKSKDANIKNRQQELNDKMFKLEKHVLKEFSNLDTSLINKERLEQIVDNYYEPSEVKKLQYLTEFCNNFMTEIPYRVTQNGKHGVANSTLKKYKTIVIKLAEFEKYSKKIFLVENVDLDFRTEFIKYLKEEDRLADNTIGRYLRVVKSICLEAERKGIKTSPQLKYFKGFSVDAPKIILSLDELAKINDVKFINEKHEIAKDWLIIGCYAGQRVSDLMRVNSGFVQKIDGFDFIVLEQIKTGKIVQIPLHHEVKKILDKRNGEFPPIFVKNMDSNSTLFNRYLKELCEIAKINTMVEGNFYNSKTKRTVRGVFEKHKLVSSHICRRSFATNFYAKIEYPTPLLMNITGHSTEKMFLEYIGMKPIDYSLQLAKIWKDEIVAGNNDSHLKIVS